MPLRFVGIFTGTNAESKIMQPVRTRPLVRVMRLQCLRWYLEFIQVSILPYRDIKRCASRSVRRWGEGGKGWMKKSIYSLPLRFFSSSSTRSPRSWDISAAGSLFGGRPVRYRDMILKQGRGWERQGVYGQTHAMHFSVIGNRFEWGFIHEDVCTGIRSWSGGACRFLPLDFLLGFWERES